jgi:hypothetical protein
LPTITQGVYAFLAIEQICILPVVSPLNESRGTHEAVSKQDFFEGPTVSKIDFLVFSEGREAWETNPETSQLRL